MHGPPARRDGHARRVHGRSLGGHDRDRRRARAVHLRAAQGSRRPGAQPVLRRDDPQARLPPHRRRGGRARGPRRFAHRSGRPHHGRTRRGPAQSPRASPRGSLAPPPEAPPEPDPGHHVRASRWSGPARGSRSASTPHSFGLWRRCPSPVFRAWSATPRFLPTARASRSRGMAEATNRSTSTSRTRPKKPQARRSNSPTAPPTITARRGAPTANASRLRGASKAGATCTPSPPEAARSNLQADLERFQVRHLVWSPTASSSPLRAAGWLWGL